VENDRIIAETTAWNHGEPPDIVWQIAGAAHPSLFLETPLEIQRSQMDTNYWGACYLAYSTLRAWTQPSTADSKITGETKAKGKRQLIMTSSVAALMGFAGYAPYSPGKAAMRSLVDTLRSEMNLYNGSRRSKDPAVRDQAPDKDISVHLVFPGTITSPGLANENLTKHAVTHILEEGDITQTEDEVAAGAVKGLEKGGYLITTQILGHAMMAGGLGASPRNSVVVDTLFSWLVSIIYLFVVPDMEGKVFKYGKEHGVKSVKKEESKKPK
jgi:3-dehydrosphinganine reductase